MVFLTFKQEYFKGYRLSLTQRIGLAVLGYTKVFSVDLHGMGPLDFYAFRCPEHGLVISRANGYSGRLFCPYCPIFDEKPSERKEPNEYEKIKVS